MVYNRINAGQRPRRLAADCRDPGPPLASFNGADRQFNDPSLLARCPKRAKITPLAVRGLSTKISVAVGENGLSVRPMRPLVRFTICGLRRFCWKPQCNDVLAGRHYDGDAFLHIIRRRYPFHSPATGPMYRRAVISKAIPQRKNCCRDILRKTTLPGRANDRGAA